MTPDSSSSYDKANLLATIVETADDAIISKDLTGTITSWNRAAERIFGYSANEVIGGPISVIIPPERGEEEVEILRKIGSGEKIEHFETERMRRDGTRVAVSVTISPLFKDGRVVGASKIARDISDRKQAVQQLQEERARLEVTLSSIGDAVIVTDMNGAVRFMNPVAEALTGWTAAEARGQALESVFHIVNETTRRRAENPTIKALRDGLVVGLANHTVLISKSGSEYSIDDSAAPIADGAKQVTGVVLVFRDVSGAKAQEAFRARLAAIVQSSDDAIISKDLTGRIISWNPGATRLFGYTAEEAIGRPISILIPPDRLSEETMVLARLRRGERIEHLDTIRITKERRKVNVLLTISPVHDAEGNVIGASKIARDITGLKRTEQELAEARERLENYSRELEQTVQRRTAELHTANQELEAFSYTAAHDLRTPLRNMRGILQVFDEEVGRGLPAEQREMINRLLRSTERMSRLLEGLLSFSQVGKHQLQRTRSSLDELLQQAISELKPEIEKRQIEWKIAPLPIVECDPGLMEQALTNLLSNALKYTQPRSVAKIEAGQVPHGGEVAIYVKDNGIGFNMEQAEKLFTPFHRLHPERQFKGSGIGLATVERIIRRHGGRIWAESKPDEGATFYFTLGPPGVKAASETLP